MDLESLSVESLSQELAGRPFRSQLAIIDRCLASTLDPTHTLRAAAILRDHEALAYLVRELAQLGRLAEAGVQGCMTELFKTLPETAAHRILRGLERIVLKAAQLEPLVLALVSATLAMDLSRLALLCLIDRWLKNAAPLERDKMTEQALQTCRRAISEKEIENLPDPLLLRVPGRELGALFIFAQEHDEEKAWEQRLQRFAARVMDILGNVPKSLSQANAEDILARRVYTDPGHFLIELLQNAEDAGASIWELNIGAEEIALWHDGVPFDARDVVGVLSIGQTTKKKDQIGFFGVGFKSVYEVCERPQIYSELFQFEVADVSIPRPLGERPDGHPAHGTLIVLPLRNPKDPKRSPDKLYEKAAEVPGQTLLTLPHLKELNISGPADSRRTRQEKGPKPNIVCLIHGEAEADELFLIEEEEFQYDGSREASKAVETPVLVAVALDHQSCPRPLPADLPTIFSYLPTGERSGLKFLLHAHFDLPVDRERLDLSSVWNRWAIGHAGRLLGKMLQRLCEDLETCNQQLECFLDVLPLPNELGHDAYGRILEQFRERTAALPFLPGADGQRRRVDQSRLIADDSLLELLQHSPLDQQNRRALKGLSARSQIVVGELGVRGFGLEDLINLIKWQLEKNTIDRGKTAWITDPSFWNYISITGQPKDFSVLAGLAAIPDHESRLAVAAELCRGSGELRALYKGTRALLLEELDCPNLQPLWEALGCRLLTVEDLIEDLKEQEPRGLLIEKNGVHEILSTLQHCSADHSDQIGHLALFPNVNGDLCSLYGNEDGQGIVWLSPRGPLGDFLNVNRRDWPLVSGEVQGAFESALRHWGADFFDLFKLFDYWEESEADWDSDLVLGLHKTIEEMREDLTIRLTQRLIALRLFPNGAGGFGALIGEDPVLIPGDRDIQRIFGHWNWVHEELLSCSYLRQLGVETTGANVVAESLLLKREGLLNPFDDHDLRSAYRYLCCQPNMLSTNESLLSQLMDAPIWLDRIGQRRTFFELRQWPEIESLQSFYTQWEDVPFIERSLNNGRQDDSDCSTLDLVETLRLLNRLKACDFATLIEDLQGLDLSMFQEETVLRSALKRVLNDAVEFLSKGQLIGVAQLPIFQSQEGGFYSLEPWGSEEWLGCRRASGAMRGLFKEFSGPLLAGKEEEDWAGLLAGLGFKTAGFVDLVREMERTGTGNLPGNLNVTTLRRALARASKELLTVPEGESEGAWRRRLSALQIWPVSKEQLRSATDVVRSRAIEKSAPSQLLDYWGTTGQLLLEDAEDDAGRLASAMAFQDPVELLYSQVLTEVKEGHDLVKQPAFLRDRKSHEAIFLILASKIELERLLQLPIALDGSLRLVRGPLFGVSQSEAELLEDLGIGDKLADSEWGQVAQKFCPTFIELLPPGRILLALSEASRNAVAVGEGERFGDGVKRQIFYSWVWQNRLEISEDVHARGQLGRCAAFLTQGQFLRAPRDLLLENDAPDLGIDWNTDEEVPEQLVTWLRETFAPSEAHLDRLVSFLLDAHEKCASKKDGERSAELLRYLARALRVLQQTPKELERLTRKYKIHRRVRVQIQGEAGPTKSSFRKPGQLLFPPPDGLPGLESFWKSPPHRVHERYAQDDTRALILALGARADLSNADIQRVLNVSERYEGEEAQLGFARCLGRVLGQRPSLLGSLKGISWLPDRAGRPQKPEDLYWPSAEMEALIGLRDGCYPHAEFVYTLSSEGRQGLPFRNLDDVYVEDVRRHLQSLDAAASDLVLEWLEERVRNKSLDPKTLRQSLGTLEFLEDQWGRRRRPRELLQQDSKGIFGERRALWSDGKKYPRLLAAFQIPSIGRRSLSSYNAELLADYDDLGDQLLVNERSLAQSLPKFLAALADAQLYGLRAALLLVEDLSGDFHCMKSTDRRLAFLSPEDLAGAVTDAKIPIFSPIILDDHMQSCRTYLEGLGVGDLTRLWKSWEFPEELEGDVSDRYGSEIESLMKCLNEWYQGMPLIEASLPSISSRLWGWTDQNYPLELIVVGSLQRSGTILDIPISVNCDGAYDVPRRRLILTISEFESPEDFLPGLLCRSWLTPGAEPPLLCAMLSEFLLEKLGRGDLPDLFEAHGQRLIRVAKKAPSERLTPVLGEEEKGDEEDELAGESEAERRNGAWSKLSRWLWGGSEESEDEKAIRETKESEHRRELRKQERALGKAERNPRRAQRDSSAGTDSRQPEDDGDGEEEAEWQPPNHKNWFRLKNSVRQQLKDHSRQQQDSERPPSFGFAFQPAQLPIPFLYGPGVIAGRFESRGQRWIPGNLEDQWSRGREWEGFRVAFQGKAPSGEVALPLPLYSRIGEIDAGKGARVIRRTGRLPVLIMPESREIRFEFIFDEIPDFQAGAGSECGDAPAELLRHTAPDKELPEAVLLFVEQLKFSGLSGWKRAIAVREFIRKNYRYDPTYLEDPAIARWLAQVSRGATNQHLAALHAGRDSQYLGRGVCYELNVLACELLRRSGVAAAIASGWTFDRGFISEPDHLWAHALLPSKLGLRWWPVDASTTVEGRPLHGFRRPAPRWRARRAKQKRGMPKAPKWADTEIKGLPEGRGIGAPVGELVRLIGHLNREMGKKALSEAQLRVRCRALLANPVKVKELWQRLQELEGDSKE
jgi:hypothetical protein